MSYSTAAALRTMVRQNIVPKEALTTAFFCEYFNKWFDIMNCRFMGNVSFVNSKEKLFFLNEVGGVLQMLCFSSVFVPHVFIYRSTIVLIILTSWQKLILCS